MFLFDAIVAAHSDDLWPSNRSLELRYYNTEDSFIEGFSCRICRTQVQLL